MATRGLFSVRSLRSQAFRYAKTLAIVSVAIGLRWFLEPQMERVGFSLFLAAVPLGAWVGGVGPSLLGQTILLVVHAQFFDSSNAQGWQPTIKGFVSVGAYYLVGIVVGALSEARHAAVVRVERQRREIAEREEQFRATLSCIGDGVLVTDAEFRLMLMNPVAEAMIGHTNAEACGMPLERIFVIDGEKADDPEAGIVDLAIHQDCRVRSSGVWLAAKGGRRIPVAYTASPVRDESGRPVGMVLIFRDETERRQAEQELREANRRKDEFLATLAHELRNPLAPIRNGLELLRLARGNAGVADEVHGIMERQTGHMIRLIDDLLDVSRITRGKIELHKTMIDLEQVVTNAVDAVRPLADAGGQELRVELPERTAALEADPHRLTQILTNLLHNAIKFTPSGGHIGLRAELDDRELRLLITDDGRGIAPDLHDAVFEMFNQGAIEKESGKTGLGVGLTLARRLAELHGGTIDVHSPGLDLGSTFRVRLPRTHLSGRRPEPVKSNGPAAPPDPRSGYVLLVDDNEDALQTLALLVRTLGNKTCIARDGLEALDVAREYRPEVVLMDLGMPRLNGYETASRMRQEPWARDTVLIALTGWGQDKDRHRTREAGFDHHLVKPVELETLRALLEESTKKPDGLVPIPSAAE